ncbi:MAG: glycerol-3-phosphate transporter ATP-binding subunit [Pseudomonadota bacterium]|jgi:multiple sugar transport system ATP-binding protein
MAAISFGQVRKVYDNGHVAVAGASFEVADGELMVLVGPSGCGKSTLLRMVAGLEGISSGTLAIGGRVVNELPPRERDIAMVFQSYALYPHMSVRQNLAFGLKLRGTPRAETDARVRDAAATLGLGDVLERRPRELSGGQRQRVALGRALVRQPQVFLLDEPLSNLDAQLRASMRTEIARLHRTLGATMLYVTHDQVEAMTLGQRIVVLDGGEVQQIDTPMRLYEDPDNLFVAGFMGSPAMNVLRGRLDAGAGPALRWQGGGELRLPDALPASVRALGDDAELVVGLRPEDLRPASGAGGIDATDLQVSARLEAVEPVGNEIFLALQLQGVALHARVPPQPLPAPGEALALGYSAGRLRYFEPGSGKRLR